MAPHSLLRFAFAFAFAFPCAACGSGAESSIGTAGAAEEANASSEDVAADGAEASTEAPSDGSRAVAQITAITTLGPCQCNIAMNIGCTAPYRCVDSSRSGGVCDAHTPTSGPVAGKRANGMCAR